MNNLTVAVIGDIGYSKNLGKAGTTSDITLYNLKQGDSIVTMIEPTRYPEKFSSLFYSVSISDYVIFIVKNIDRLFGEMVVTLDMLGKKDGCFILKNYYSDDDVKKLVKNTALSNYSFFDDNPTEIREMLVEKARMNRDDDKTSDTKGSVTIDHFFNVRGIGAVVLGLVISGIVRRHDKMNLLPLEREVQIRSIQKHDEDFDLATRGDRVGLALKNVEVDELDRGYVLSSEDDLISQKELDLRLKKSFLSQKDLKIGDVVHLGHWMQFIPARVTYLEKMDNNNELLLKVSLDKAIVLKKNSKMLLSDLNDDRLRVIGSATID